MARSAYLETAIEAAKAAEAVIRHYYQQQLEITLKEDRSPVTVADVEAEKAIKAVINAAFPDHGFYGEETGQEQMDAEYVWLIDPIDGTKSFVRGYPFFSTQIALRRGEELLVGCSNAPLFGELAYAERGEGAWLQEQPIRVSEVDELSQATLSTGNLKSLAGGAGWARLGRLIEQVNRIRGYGDFYHYHLLASGRIDLVVESDVNILDIAALQVIISEAGGVFTDLDGAPVGLETRSVAAANSARMHERLLNQLRGDS